MGGTWTKSNLSEMRNAGKGGKKSQAEEQAKCLERYGEISSEVPESVIGVGVMLYAMVSSVCEVVGGEDGEAGSELDHDVHRGTLGPGMVSICHGDDATIRVARGELELSVLEDNSKLDSRMLVAIDR